MLEDKIKEYLYNLKFYDYRLSEDLGTLKNKMAKDIAEICENYNANLFPFYELEKENAGLKDKILSYNPTKQLELEQQIANQKYLDYDKVKIEVEKFINPYHYFSVRELTRNICNLAIKPLDKDSDGGFRLYSPQMIKKRKELERLKNEILNNKE